MAENDNFEKQNIEYIKRYRETGDDIYKEKIIELNKLLIARIINDNKEYLKKLSSLSISSINEDLFQEANVALLKAIDDFDFNKNCRFSTHAYTYIQNALKLFIKNNRGLIKIPVDIGNKIFKVKRFMEDYFIKNKVYPSTKEIAEELNDGTSEEKIKIIIIYSQSINNNTITLSELKDNYNVESDEYMNNIFQSNLNNPEEEYKNEELIYRILKATNSLKADQKFVFIARFIDNRTLEDIAKELNCSIENVRQKYYRACEIIAKRLSHK